MSYIKHEKLRQRTRKHGWQKKNCIPCGVLSSHVNEHQDCSLLRWTPCSLIDTYQHYGGTHRIHLNCSSRMLVHIHLATMFTSKRTTIWNLILPWPRIWYMNVGRSSTGGGYTHTHKNANQPTIWTRDRQLCNHFRTSQHFMELESSLLHSQELPTYSYPKQEQSSPHNPFQFLQDVYKYTRVVRKRRFPMICHNEKHVYWHWIIHFCMRCTIFFMPEL
jgi:hypothetical protein